MNHRRLLRRLLAALLTIGGVASAQRSVRLTVRVVDSSSHQPIRRAAIEPRWAAVSGVAPPGESVAPRFTDPNGVALLSLPAGAGLDLTVRSIGFQSSRRRVTAAFDDTIVIALARVPVRLDVVVVRADNKCPDGMGRAADAIAQWGLVTNALAIAADYEADSASTFEVRSFQRLWNLRDSLTDESEIVASLRAAPSISARSESWIAANGFVSRQGQAMEIEVPSPVVLKSRGFERSHCFAVMGDSAGLIQLDFAPLTKTRKSDVAGEMLLDRQTLAPVAIRIRYLGVPLGAGAQRVHATLDFDRSAGTSIYLRQWHLDLPLFGSGIARRVAGMISQGQEIQLHERANFTRDVEPNDYVRVHADCGLLPVGDCLTRGNDELSGSLNGEGAPLRALGYYRAACSSGPSRAIARIAEDTGAIPEQRLALVDSIAVGVDSAREARRGGVLDALYTRGTGQLSAMDQATYAQIAQVDACSRAALLMDEYRSTLGAVADAERAGALLAACDGGEGLACLWGAPVVGTGMSAADSTDVASALVQRACRLALVRACRLLREADVTSRADTLARLTSVATGFLLADTATRAQVDSIVGQVMREPAAPLLRDVERFPGGILVTFYPDHSERIRRDRLEPADSMTLGAIAALLHARRDLEALVVVHTDPIASGRLGRQMMRDELEREAAGYLGWFQEHGVAAGRVRTAVVNDDEPAASPSTLLGRQFDRRLEIAIRARRGNR